MGASTDQRDWGWRSDVKQTGGGELIDTGYHGTYRLLSLAGSGISHVAGGLPPVSAPFDELWAAGGMLGALVSVPLAGLISGPGAMAVMIALALLSLMILTATPFRHIPARFREGYEKLMGRREAMKDRILKVRDGIRQGWSKIKGYITSPLKKALGEN